jgi:hypothetical protein
MVAQRMILRALRVATKRKMPARGVEIGGAVEVQRRALRNRRGMIGGCE